ncbi:serine--tRNA ligase [Candidatus Woesebacteria bacterium]|nr:serine--tRNA ligase [Candidatus Woesebacteria bacterium]
MIDIIDLRDNPEKFKKATQDKQLDPSIIDEVIKLDEQRRKLIREVEDLRKNRNEIAEKVKEQGGKPSEEQINKGKEVKEKLQSIEPDLIEVEEIFQQKLFLIPNPPADDVPKGKGEEDNKEVRKWSPSQNDFADQGGDPIIFDFEPKDHLQLGEELGIIDFESGAKVTGSQFYYLKGDGALLELALLQFGVEFLSKKGFTPFITPDLAKSRFYLGTGYQPKGDEAQTYEIKDEDLGLIATAEVTMAGLHADEILPGKELPYKYAAISHCFRKEAGAYGKYSKGLYRVHQFTKLEMFVYCKPEDSEKMHQEILSIEEEITQALGIPYRVVEMCTGDLGAMASRKYDLEAWMPGRGDYGEITSTSNTTDYQARNLNIKFNDKGENEYVHMLNGTALVTSRIPIAILENYQQKDGSVLVPEILRKWVGKDKFTKNE